MLSAPAQSSLEVGELPEHVEIGEVPLTDIPTPPAGESFILC